MAACSLDDDIWQVIKVKLIHQKRALVECSMECQSEFTPEKYLPMQFLA
jgi:hypothetical protein